MRALQEYHHVWLQANNKDEQWLRLMFKEGFHIHHIDGDHDNNDAKNLVLIWGIDHFMLHSGVRFVRGKNSGKKRPKVSRPRPLVESRETKKRKPRLRGQIFPCGCIAYKKLLQTCDNKAIELYSNSKPRKVVAAYHSITTIRGIT
jgi:hypothetical protein